MTALLELRENLKKIYSRNEAFILPVIKFLLSFIVLSIINGKMGYMTKLDNMAIVLIVSLLCSFLPTGFMAFFAMMFAVLHMYALSIETAAVGLVVFLLLYLLFLRFTAKEALVVVLTPVLCMLKLPYVMPVAMGLIGTPASCVSVGCGVVVYYLLQTVITNAPTINSMGAEEATAKLRLRNAGEQGNAGDDRSICHYRDRGVSDPENECGSLLDHCHGCRRYDRSDDPAGGRSDVRYQSLHRQRTVRCRCYADRLQDHRIFPILSGL